MTTKIFDHKHYYNATALKELYPTLLPKTRYSSRKIIEKYNIPQKYYVFASSKSGKYYLSNVTNKRAILFIKKSYINKHLIKISSDDEILINQKQDLKDSNNNNIPALTYNEEKINKNETAIILPINKDINKKILLKFSFLKNFLLKRNYEKLDENSNSNNINYSIKDKTSLFFKKIIPYFLKNFIVKKNDNNIKIKEPTKLRNEFDPKYLGIPMISMKKSLKTSLTPISCIYLFTLGYVNDLRNSLKISKNYSDNMIVCKYGYTNNLYRRFQDHQKTLGTIENVSVGLKYYVNIDESKLSQAETDLSKFCELMNAKFSHNTYKELIIISKEKLDNSLKNQYISIGKNYNQSVEVLKSSYDTEIMKLKCQINVLNQEIKIVKLENMLEKQKIVY